MARPLLCSLRGVRVVGRWRGGKLWPDSLPVVGEHGLARDSAAGEGLDGRAMLDGDRPLTARHLVDKRRDDAEVLSQPKRSPPLGRKP